MKLSKIWFLLLILIVGCDRQTVNETPPPTMTVPLPTATDEPSTSATITSPASTPTATILPKATPTSSPPTATPDFQDAALFDVDPRLSTTSVSPDGTWTAEVIVAFGDAGNYYRQLYVSSAKASYLLIDEWSPTGLGFLVPRIVQWANDSSALFYAEEATADGCGIFPFRDQLARLDFATGTTEMLPKDWSPAPDGASFAYFEEGALRLIQDGVDHDIALESSLAEQLSGAIVWHPTSDRLAYTAVVNPCADQIHSIVLVDVGSGHAEIIYSEENQPNANRTFLRTVAWNDDDTLKLRDRLGNFWLLNLEAGQLSPLESP